MKKNSDTSQTASQRTKSNQGAMKQTTTRFTKKKAIFNLKFSRKVVSSYKKEANKLKMKPH